jgi:hypothetical protein
MNRKPFFSILRLALPLAAAGLLLATLFLATTSPAWAALGGWGYVPCGRLDNHHRPGVSFDVWRCCRGVTNRLDRGQYRDITCMGALR